MRYDPIVAIRRQMVNEIRLKQKLRKFFVGLFFINSLDFLYYNAFLETYRTEMMEDIYLFYRCARK